MVALLAVTAGCKKKRRGGEAADKIEVFAEQLCACKDQACAVKVNDEYVKWGSEMARDATPDTRPDPRSAHRVTEAVTKYTECYTKLASQTPPAEPLDPGPAVDAMVVIAPARVGDVYVEHLIDDARKWIKRDWPELVVTSVTAKYIRPTGVLDPKYGAVEIEVGIPDRPVVDDDPDRPTGAPIEPAPENIWTDRTDCPYLKWSDGDWAEDLKPCRKTRPIVGPKCQANAIWQRAIAQKAPDNAVAILTITGDSWQFSIKDPVRKVDFMRRYVDDCKPVLEQK